MPEPREFAAAERRSDEITVLDLFAGAGGLSAGLHAASKRFRVVKAVEMDSAAAASYALNFGGEDVVFNGDIADWLRDGDVPEVDVVVGGPPCQGFSLLGKRDEADVRNFLWKEYAEALRRARPKYFVLENVGAFSRSQQFTDISRAIEPGGELEEYDFAWSVLNAADYGAPQARKRAILIGWRRDMAPASLPDATHTRDTYVTVRKTFKRIPHDAPLELPERSVEMFGKSFAGPFTQRELHVDRDYAEISRLRFPEIPEGGNRTDLPDHLKAPCWIGHTSGSGDVMGRLHWDRPSVTIRTEFFKPEKGRYLHPVAHRAITHYEAARLQGFPRGHKFVGSRTAIARQIGNAVPIALGRAIGLVLADLLSAGGEADMAEG